MARHWIAVASAEHVALGLAEGFMQVGHGKGAPLKRLQPGDTVAYYSPAERLGQAPSLQAFTAVGQVADREPWQHDMGEGFVPWRRAVQWTHCGLSPIRPLLPHLSFTRGRPNWGAPFRYGFFEAEAGDLARIAEALLPLEGSPVA